MSLIQNIITHYKSQYPFQTFYDQLIYNINTWPQFHINDALFLKGYEPQSGDYSFKGRITTKSGDIRVDLPVWFGHQTAPTKIVLLGLEPRDTDKEGILNIERFENNVYATPFALEKGKLYYNAFKQLFREQHFVYFTDVVKFYKVNNTATDDASARNNFSIYAKEGADFLLRELNFIQPNHVVAVGTDAHNFLSNLLGNKYGPVIRLRHPANAGSNKTREQLNTFLLQSNLA